MEKAKDTFWHLTKLFSDEKTDELRAEGLARLQTIQHEMMELQQESGAVRYLLTKAGVLPTAPIPQMIVQFPTPVPAPMAAPGGSSANIDQAMRQGRAVIVRQTALELVNAGKMELTTNDVLDALSRKHINLGVSRPGSMVGTVLKGMKKEFDRVEMNRFKYIGGVSLKPSDMFEEVPKAA